MVRRGLILQPTYRVENDRPVVHLWGKLESGESFLVRDDRQRPHFFIPKQASDAARDLGVTAILPTPRRDLQNQELLRVEVDRPSDTPPLRARLTEAGIPCLEADVRFAMRYLIDRQIKGAVRIHGEPRPGDGVALVFDNPEIEPATARPRLTVLSVDIETDPRSTRGGAAEGLPTREATRRASTTKRLPPARAFCTTRPSWSAPSSGGSARSTPTSSPGGT
jgi:DNA polymerase-2